MSAAPPPPMTQPATWDAVAHVYAERIAPVFVSYAERALDLAALAPNARVLDVATGPGTLAFRAAQRGHTVTALDFAPEMIATLRARAAKDASLAKVNPIVGDGMALPLGDVSVDNAFSMFGLIFFPDRGRGLRELHRVLVPGGRAVISSWVPVERIPFFAAIFGRLAELMPPSAAPPQPPMSTPEDCLADFTAAGFTDVVVDHATFAFEEPSLAELWSWFPASCAPLAALARNVGEEKWKGIAAELHEAALARFGAGPIRMEMPALLTVGTKR
jgi:ubiquinone/menaquinone biosynthesis C-methylase UbiE